MAHSIFVRVPTQAHLYSSHETSINTHMHALLRASDKTHKRTHRRQHRARGSVRPLGIAIHQYVRISFSSSSAAKCCGNCVGMSRAHTHTHSSANPRIAGGTGTAAIYHKTCRRREPSSSVTAASTSRELPVAPTPASGEYKTPSVMGERECLCTLIPALCAMIQIQ